MERKICAATVQFNISMGGIDQNLQKALAGIRRVREKDARLAVLPEMWSTGYDYKRLAALAEETPSTYCRTGNGGGRQPAGEGRWDHL